MMAAGMGICSKWGAKPLLLGSFHLERGGVGCLCVPASLYLPWLLTLHGLPDLVGLFFLGLRGAQQTAGKRAGLLPC
jgi:hypothetical protein